MSVPTDAQFYSREDPTKPDIAFLKNHFYREGRVTEEQALYILEKGTELLRAEPNLLEVDAPITGEFLRRRRSMQQLSGDMLFIVSLRRHPRAICARSSLYVRVET